MLNKEEIFKKCKTKEDFKNTLSNIIDGYNALQNECCIKIDYSNISKEQLYKKLFVELLKKYYEFQKTTSIFDCNLTPEDSDLVLDIIETSKIEKFTDKFWHDFRTLDIVEKNVEINGEIHSEIITGCKCYNITDIDETLEKLDINSLFEE